MSVDLMVYSRRPEPLQREALGKALRDKGWHSLFLEPEHLTEARGGTLDQEVVFAAKNTSDLEQLQKVLAGDRNKLETLFEEGKVGGCGVSAAVPFNPRDEFGDGLEKQVGGVIAEEILNANSLYNVTSSGGQTDLSAEFQEVVWKTLGALVGGLLEDPQTGEYIRCTPRGEEVLAAMDDSKGSPIGELKKYFEGAKAAGFPVQADKDDVRLNTEELSPADLERLLKFTRQYFPKGDSSGSAMVLMILEEYERKKGKVFARDHAEWLTRMQENYGQF